jgi:acetyl-CoA acetyltransferase
VTAVVAGVGVTRFAARSRHSEAALAMTAITRALADAGLGPRDVDGVVRFDRDAVWEFDLTGGLGVRDLAFYDAVPSGPGSAPALLRLAAMAIATRRARVVVAYHAQNPLARGGGPGIFGDRLDAAVPFQTPFGIDGAVHAAALLVRRHLHAHRMPPAALAEIAVRSRRNAARNPRAIVRQLLSRAGYRRSAYVAEPIRTVDCAPPSAGAVCLVVTSGERARDLRRPAVHVLGSAQLVLPSWRQLDDWFRPGRAVAFRRARRALFGGAGVVPRDVDVACLYDVPAPLVLLGLEAWGLSGQRAVLNPHGGQLCEASLAGVNDLAEAVRQLRGEAANQVRGARVALVAGSPIESTSAVLLGTPTLSARRRASDRSRGSLPAASPRRPSASRPRPGR